MEPEANETSRWFDTIAARATPPGVGAIGVIRVSGQDSWPILDRIFRLRGQVLAPGGALPGRMYLGEITGKNSSRLLDEVLVLFWKGPRSYTGEDCVEIQCHGGPLVLRQVLDRVLAEGARPAEPGEFTRRALLNGRIDLAQAEAVLDVIEAKSPIGLASAVARLGGELSADLKAIREDLLDALACLEASLDFPEDGIEAEAKGAFQPLVARARASLGRLCRSYGRGKIHRHGVRATLAGRPNVGKSSLFNRLLCRERSIVTSFPGTTRDVIEETVLIGGVPFRLADTAGVRNEAGGDPIESLASEIALRSAEEADLRILVLDSSAPLTGDDREALRRTGRAPAIVVLNKCDLRESINEGEVRGLMPEADVVRVSALTGEGIGLLEAAMAYAAERGDGGSAGEAPLVQSERHYELISRALAAVERASGVPGADEDDGPGAEGAVVAIELREATAALGELLGEGLGEDVLDRIFRRFCVGK